MGGIYDPEIAELLGGPPSASSDESVPVSFQGADRHGTDLMIVGDAYEGANRFSHELASYVPSTRSPDQDIKPGKRTADARARDLTRNDANIQSGVRLRQDGVVGAMFLPNPRPNSERLFGKEDVKWEDEHADEITDLWMASAEGQNHWLDAGGRMTVTEMTRLAVEQDTVYGESTASVEWIKEGGRPFNTAIQMIDTDRLSSPLNNFDPKISMGVELGVRDQPIAYHIRMAHPSDWQRGMDANRWKRINAQLRWGRKQFIHIYTMHRPGQTRGMGTMVAAIPEMKMARQFRETVLQNAILNATYAATIESELDPATIFAKLGGTSAAPDEIQQAIYGYMAGYANMLGSVVGGSNNLKMGGVKIPHLPPGSKLQLQGAGQGGPLGSEFEASLNRVMASAFGVSYEQFSRDYTKTNYSSGKMASVETYKAMMTIKRAVADRFASTVYRLWYEEMLNRGAFTTVKRVMPSFYEGFNADWYCTIDWVGASRGQVDELKETQAAILRLNNGLSTLEEENARLGKNWRKSLKQLRQEQDWKKFYDVLQQPTDTTNQQNAASGTKREASDGAHIPSPGTAENMFADSEYPENDREEAVNE